MASAAKNKKKQFSHNVHILINTSAVVLIWRGLWDLFDLYVFPGNTILSSLAGIAVGVFILLYKDHIIDELK